MKLSFFEWLIIFVITCLLIIIWLISILQNYWKTDSIIITEYLRNLWFNDYKFSQYYDFWESGSFNYKEYICKEIPTN